MKTTNANEWEKGGETTYISQKRMVIHNFTLGQDVINEILRCVTSHVRMFAVTMGFQKRVSSMA